MKFQYSIRPFILLSAFLFAVSVPRAFAEVTVFAQPDNQVMLVGDTASFSAVAVALGGETVTGYTWLMSPNGQNPFATVATTASFSITNVQTTNTGVYFARVTYLSGTTQNTRSSPALNLTVHDQARIVEEPQSLSRLAGENAMFTVQALGMTPLSYQWRYNGSPLSEGGRVTGAASNALRLDDLVYSDSGNYEVVVSNLYGVVTSKVAVLNVLVPPSILIQPANATVVRGSNATFNVSADGTEPLTYRWIKDDAFLANGSHVTGAGSNTLTILGATTNDTGLYRVSVSNGVGLVESSNVMLTVLVPPEFISATNAVGRQGAFFSYTNVAAGSEPMRYAAEGLPGGLSLQPTNGVISGIPAVTGVFNVTLYATNPAATGTGNLTITLTTGVPGITSDLSIEGVQGQPFSYAITASNDPVSFTASGLPAGLELNPVTGVITGRPILNGPFFVTIGAVNQYGADSQTLELNLVSVAPIITSPLTASGTENQAGFSYTITATNSPVSFGASGLPLGLFVNPLTGEITGTPLYGGSFEVLIWADNAWGRGSATLTLNLDYAVINALEISDVAYSYASPYLLDFSFSLRDDPDPLTSQPIVRPLSQIQVVCLEDGVPIGTETALIFDHGNRKQLKSFLLLDYTYSMFISPGAIESMQQAAKTLINEEPVSAQFGVYEFHADYLDPQLVTGFTSDKEFLAQTIDGIETNYVQGNYAGTRAFDAIYAALNQFSSTNRDEQRCIVVMTDGNDESSLLNTNDAPIDLLVSLAQTNQVRIYCVAFGPNINVPALQQLTSETLGRYYEAATTEDLSDQFRKIVKDIDGQYLLRWATLKRADKAFQPSFQITLDGLTASFNTNVIYETNIVEIDPGPPPVEETNVVKITEVPDYNPLDWAGDVQVGNLRLVADADLGPQTVRLRATYVPRFVRELRINYRANYPCTVSLNSTRPGEILSGWSLSETNDGNGGHWLTLMSPDPTNLLTSIPYGAFGDLVAFHFQYPDLLTGQQAFSAFVVDNSIYTNLPPTGQSFSLENINLFTTVYDPPPPHGTPIPWLMAYGFTNNFADAELSDPNGNGLAVWQEYLAGLNPLDPNSRFSVQLLNSLPASPPQIVFNTVRGRTYRLESATTLSDWTILLDGINGTGGDISYTDFRDLSAVGSVYYRVAVY